MWILIVLRKQLRREVDTREKSSLGQFNNDTPAKSHSSKSTPAGALLSGAAVEEDKVKKGCIFCDGSHPSDSFNIVPSVDQRLGILRRHRGCFKCLRKNHLSKSGIEVSSASRNGVPRRWESETQTFGIKRVV